MFGELSAIALLLLVISLVVWRLPKVDLGHAEAFTRRRTFNWIPLGLTYAFLYMGRYNLAAAKDVGAITQEQYGDIFGWGALAYGASFLISGPLADTLGGRTTILMSAAGSALCNVGMGIAMTTLPPEQITAAMTVLYALNMHFQSYGAVSVVKVNSAWFHVRERGVYGGLFGVLISLGIYFAFDWGHLIAKSFDSIGPLFYIPAAILVAWFCIDLFLVQATPSGAGFDDFDVGDASSGDTGPPLSVVQVVLKMVTNPVILTIAAIEFCSGFLRNAIMHWYRDFAKGMSLTEAFVYEHWGAMLCIAGITGGMFAGVISDRVFDSRRGPVAAVLYGFMVVGALAIVPLMTTPALVGPIVIFMSMAVIGVHGMLSGTASADFGGKKNAGVAVGLIDACVYAGTGLQAFLLGRILPAKGTAEAADVANWAVWPWAMFPIALLGLILAASLWNARPQGNKPTAAADSEAA